jgi:hypothetical protein
MAQEKLPYMVSASVFEPYKENIIAGHNEEHKAREQEKRRLKKELIEGLVKETNIKKPHKGALKSINDFIEHELGPVQTGDKNASENEVLENIQYIVTSAMYGAFAMAARRQWWAENKNASNGLENDVSRYLLMESRDQFSAPTLKCMELGIAGINDKKTAEARKRLANDFYDWAIAHPNDLGFGRIVLEEPERLYLLEKDIPGRRKRGQIE